MSGVYKDKVDQELRLSAVEAVMVESADGVRLQGLREQRAAGGDGHIEVVNGKPVGATLFYLRASVEDVQLKSDGQPWTGSLISA